MKNQISARLFSIKGTALLFTFMLIVVTSAFGGIATELLSDACISDIAAGAAGDSIITAFYETPSSAYIDSQPRWWGDMDGYADGCAKNSPGFVVTGIPYNDFQYDSFKYSFKNQSDLDRFLKDLSSSGGAPVNVIATDYIKSNPGADHAFSDDGTAPRIHEIIITTDQKINGAFIRSYNGQVITQKVRLDMEFLPPYAKSYTIEQNASDRSGRALRLVHSPAFRNYNQYEWVQSNHTAIEVVRNADGTYYFTQSSPRTYNFGAVFLECTATDSEPLLSNTGRIIVPANKTYLKNTIFNDINVFSPAVGLTIGLAPQKKSDNDSGFSTDDAAIPDLDRYQELGMLEIKNLNIAIKGGNSFYIYANEELEVCP